MYSIVIILSNLKTDESLIEIFNDEIRFNLYIIIKMFKKKKNLKKEIKYNIINHSIILSVKDLSLYYHRQ